MSVSHFAIRMRRWAMSCALLIAIPACGGGGGGNGGGAGSSGTSTNETKYLAFQVDTGGPTAEGGYAGGTVPLVRTPTSSISAMVDTIVTSIGATGDTHTKLAFVMGPLAFDHTDSDITGMIHDGFAIARDKNIAIGFHIDDAMFWSASQTLLPTANDTLEWVDFTPTPSVNLSLDWGMRQPFPPRLCMNSRTVLAEVTRRSIAVFGAAIKTELDTLAAAGKSELFAGVIVGSESHMGHEYNVDVTKEQPLGFHALYNSGYGPGFPPLSFGDENARVVQQYIEHWSIGLIVAGVPQNKLYCHINFLPASQYALAQQSNPALANVSYNDFVSTAPSSINPSVAFGVHYRPGFSLYPTPGTWDAVSSMLQAHGSPPWAQSEGANAIPGLDGNSTVSGSQTPEAFLAQRFNNGATLVNIFGWGLLGNPNPFRTAAESPDAIAAYQKFLSGAPLIGN